MSSSNKTEMQEWMRQRRGFQLTEMAKSAREETPKCYECRHKIIDALAFQKNTISGRSNYIYMCIGCATAWYEGDADVLEAAAAARHISCDREYVGSSAWNWESEQLSNSLLGLIANTCVTVNSGHWNSGHVNEATEFLTFVEQCLREPPDNQSMKLYIALLGAGTESATETGAIVTSTIKALLSMKREETVPRLLEQIPKGLAGFGGRGLADAEPLPLHSWNSAFLLAKMSKIDGVMRTTPKTVDLICLILTYSPDSSPGHSSDYFPYASDAERALSWLPDDDVAAALESALSERGTYPREYIAERLAEIAARGNDTAIKALLEMCGAESVQYDSALSIVLGTKFWINVPGCFERVVRVAGIDSHNFERLLWEDKSNALATLATALKVLGPDEQNERIRESVEPGSDLATNLLIHQDPVVSEAFAQVLRSNENQGYWAGRVIDALRKNKEVSIRDAAVAAFGDDDDDQ
jgi:hypothetical protein